LAYWDELRRRHPDMLIDTCASGGKRNDLETLRRALPLLRSDCIMHSTGNQGHTYGLSSWVPYYGTGSSAIDSYATRSALCPHFTACFDMRKKDLNYAEARRLFSTWRSLANCMLHGDYYPLTPYSLDETAWIAWQFDRPENNDGVVQAFRRPESLYESIRVNLQGLDASATYVVKNVDEDGERNISGRDLLEKGLLIPIKSKPGAVIITYRKACL
jgi:alpha-galactosidase